MRTAAAPVAEAKDVRTTFKRASRMSNENANDVVNGFTRQFETVLNVYGATLQRSQQGYSGRGFAIVRAPASLSFVAKLSQSHTGFWGLGVNKAAEMIEGRGEFLVLLRNGEAGYLLNPVRLRAILPTLGTDENGHDYKIQEAKVRREMRFRSLGELAELLLPKLA